MSRLLVCFCFALGPGLSGAMGDEPYDVVVRHGSVVDGTGNPAFHADVGVRDGRIAAIGRIDGGARLELEAAGCVVAPGFLDAHTHAENVEALPLAENYARMGVTTLVAGNCGESVVDVGEFFERLERAGISLNVATLLGHGTIRDKAMGGSFDRPPETDELARMKDYVEAGMRGGALGLSTGLIYLPGVFATTEEIIELAKVVSKFDGIYASHMRDEGDEISGALEEVFRIAREADVPGHVSHIKCSGKPNWGRASAVLAAIDAARASGLDITQDMYVYPASSTGLSQLIPPEMRAGGGFADRLRNATEKARLVAEMKARLRRGTREDYAYAVIAHYEKDPRLNGLNVVEAAQRKWGRATVDDQIELILEIQANGGADGVFYSMSERDLRVFLLHPNTMIGADSSVRRFNEGVPHPRGYGNSARILARYVRDARLLRLEEAVRRMTWLVASTFRLRDRGQIRLGNWADLVVFDPEKVRDQATFERPHQYATGFKWVLVNGTVVVDHDRHTGARPGQVCRRTTGL